MSDIATFRAWLDAAIIDAPRTPNGVPLIGTESLTVREAPVAALISALADIIEATCTYSSFAVPETHAAAL
jgi:hypothetical protein